MIDINKKIIDSNNDQLNNYDEDWDDRADFAFYQKFEDFVEYQKKYNQKNEIISNKSFIISSLTLASTIAGIIVAILIAFLVH